jgi:hypothetical protein
VAPLQLQELALDLMIRVLVQRPLELKKFSLQNVHLKVAEKRVAGLLEFLFRVSRI